MLNTLKFVVGIDQSFSDTGIVVGTPQGKLLLETNITSTKPGGVNDLVSEHIYRAIKLVKTLHDVVKLPANRKVVDIPVGTARKLVGGAGWGTASKDLFHRHICQDLQLYNNPNNNIVDAWVIYTAGLAWLDGAMGTKLPLVPLEMPDVFVFVEGLSYGSNSSSVTGAAILSAVLRLYLANLVELDEAKVQTFLNLGLITASTPRKKAKKKS